MTHWLLALSASALLSPLSVLADSRDLDESPSHDDVAHDAMRLPDMVERASILSGWHRDGDWLIPAEQWAGGEPEFPTRAAAMVRGGEVQIEARTIAGDGTSSPWTEMPETAATGEFTVYAVDFGDLDGVQLRLFAPPSDLPVFSELGWRLLVPVDEAGGNSPGAPAPPANSESSARSVSQALLDIGVTPREVWGASATNCSTQEDNWYRFAVHHTAGNMTSGGTVQGAVQGLQSWSMGGGGFCDIPYQFLVGFDGTRWEGRNLNYYSGATGGGNNNGNIAISHLGCFHPSCTPEDPVSIGMAAGARWLAQTLAAEHGIVTTSSTLLGHRDHQNTSTACPGDGIHGRLDEWRSAVAHFQGTVVGTSWGGSEVTVTLGATEALWVDVRNDGMETWTSNSKLAPLPRDVASPLAASSWESGTRASGPDANTAPGGTARFSFDVVGADLGEFDLSFTLVEEWVTWFADLPVGGGPAEGAITLRVVVENEEPPTDPPADDDDATDPPADDDDSATPGEVIDDGPRPRGERFAAFSATDDGLGCGCTVGPEERSGAWLIALLGVALGLRRRRRNLPQT